MFGYVTPHRCELKVGELTQYQGWYCGLCKAIRQSYGQIPRLVLDYDCAFLALLLQGVKGPADPMVHGRCGYKPFAKKAPVAQLSGALEYAADCNVLLYYYKLEDDWRDEKKAVALGGKVLLRHAVKRAAAKQPEAAANILSGLGALSTLERAHTTEIDRVADAFGGILREIVCHYPTLNASDREVLSWLSYHLGRWIYLMDAWEDRQKDEKKGAYNPFVCSGADKAHASFLLYAALSEMEKAYDLLDIKANKGLLDNILFLGCRLRTRQLIEGVADEPI